MSTSYKYSDCYYVYCCSLPHKIKFDLSTANGEHQGMNESYLLTDCNFTTNVVLIPLAAPYSILMETCMGVDSTRGVDLKEIT